MVIPTRNRAERLLRTMGTVLAQEDVDLEVVIVDDCSSEDITPRLLALDSQRVRILRHRRQRGLPASRNSGIAVAAGEWLAFLDDDDLWSPDKLCTQLRAASRSRAGWVYGGAFILDESLGALEAPPAPAEAQVFDHLLGGYSIPAGGSNVVARTDVVVRLGGFDVNVAHLADWDLFLRLARLVPAAACPEIMVAYVTHQSNMRMDTDVASIVREFDYLAAKHSSLRSSTGSGFDSRPFWDWVIANQMRAGRRTSASKLLALRALRHRCTTDVARAAYSLVRATPHSPETAPCRFPFWASTYV